MTSLGGGNNTTADQTIRDDFFESPCVHSNSQGCAHLTATAFPGNRSGLFSHGWLAWLPRAAANDGSRSVGNFLEKQTKVPESPI